LFVFLFFALKIAERAERKNHS